MSRTVHHLGVLMKRLLKIVNQVIDNKEEVILILETRGCLEMPWAKEVGWINQTLCVDKEPLHRCQASA